MIDKVIICGIRRANTLVPVTDIQQMVGRAGRSYTKSGEAILLVPEQDEIKANNYLFGKSPPIESVMDEVDNVGFHILPMILSQQVKDEITFNKWYEKTLAYTQGKIISFKEVTDYLFEQESLINFDGKICCSDLGEISSKMYFSPARIKLLKDRMMEVHASDALDNTFAVSWMLSNDRIAIGGVDEYALGDYKSKVISAGYYFDRGELVHGYTYYCLLTGLRPKWLKYSILGEYDDFDRLMRACSMIGDSCRMRINTQIELLELSAKKRVDIDTAKTMKDIGLNKKGCILELIELGVKTKEELYEKREMVERFGSELLRTEIKKILE